MINALAKFCFAQGGQVKRVLRIKKRKKNIILISAEASGPQSLFSSGLHVGQVGQGAALPVRNFQEDRLFLESGLIDGEDRRVIDGREVGALLEPAADARRFRNPGLECYKTFSYPSLMPSCRIFLIISSLTPE